MRILLDPQIYYMQRFGGISRYFTEIYRLLKADNAVVISCPLFISNNLHLEHYHLQPTGLRVLILRIINKVFFWTRMLAKNKQYTNFLLRQKTTDIFIPTYYDPYFLKAARNIPFVLTVFDMIHELFPHYFEDNPTVVKKKLLIEKATRIIAISESTRQDIIRLYPHIDINKIHVVYLSHSIEASQLNLVKGLKDKNYILFVGRRSLYKNFAFFIKAVAGWLLQHNMHLLCMGGGAFNEEERSLITSLKLRHLVQQITFKDEELGSYYTNAFAFVFPSEYEGFGIPVLEAMYCGCPVLLPAVSSLPEVAGEAGIYFSLTDGNTLVQNLQHLHNDVNFRQEKIKLGFLQEKKFSWERTKEECLEVYELALH